MFSRVSISNFKSIKRLEFEPRRVNVLIGEPNTGKSNIIEALAVFCEDLYRSDAILREVLRFTTAADLFYDREVGDAVEVTADDFKWSLAFQDRGFSGGVAIRETATAGPSAGNPRWMARFEFTLDREGNLSLTAPPELPTRYYRYRSLTAFPVGEFGVLQPPHGANLGALLATNKRLRRLVSDLFQTRQLRLTVSPEKNELALSKLVDDQLYTYGYPAISETWRRLVFFTAVLETNQNAILLLDEPEANTFPFYTKHLAERIAYDETNQFFVTTHNPYLLSSVVQKTKPEELAVFVATMEQYHTKLTRIPGQNLPELLELDTDAFFNLDRLLHE